jgi:alpha-D-ribose 1-methylphosphonate 5-triphosphate synthase subunit PhnG
MTTNQPEQPSRIDRLEARLDQLVTITEALVQTTTIHQQNFERLVEEMNADRQQAAQDRQAWQTEIQRIWDYLLRHSGNGRQGT